MQITTTRNIDAPPSAVWRVFGEQFADIADWAGAIETSSIDGDLGQGAVRTCNLKATPPFPASTITEELTQFDADSRALTYVVLSGLPGMMRYIDNAWTIESLEGTRSRVTSQITVKVAWWAVPMLPMIRYQLGGQLKSFLGQLADHVERTLDAPAPDMAARAAN